MEGLYFQMPLNLIKSDLVYVKLHYRYIYIYIMSDTQSYTYPTAECVPNCQNGGVCTKPGVCTCSSGWHGDRCQIGTYYTKIYL